MTQKTFSKVAGAIFLVVVLLHAGRILWSWEAVIGGWQIPLWLSWGGVVAAGFLAYQGLRNR